MPSTNNGSRLTLSVRQQLANEESMKKSERAKAAWRNTREMTHAEQVRLHNEKVMQQLSKLVIFTCGGCYYSLEGFRAKLKELRRIAQNKEDWHLSTILSILDGMKEDVKVWSNCKHPDHPKRK